MHLIKGQYVLVWYFSLHALFCILFFLYNSIVFYEIFYNGVTASRDVTYLFTDPDEICIAYVKLNSKHILFLHENFLIYDKFFEIITIIMWYIQLYIYIYILAPNWGGSSTHSPLIFWDIFPTYLSMLFQQKKNCNSWPKIWVGPLNLVNNLHYYLN